MTITVDYTELGKPTVVLTLHRTPTGYYGVTDQNGRLWFPPTQNLNMCLRFLAAAAAKGHATVDDASIERATWYSTTGGGEPKPGAAACAEAPDPSSRLEPAPAGSSSPPVPQFSVAVLADVIPIRKDVA